MATYYLIASNVLSTTTTTVTFSSIPATYTDLIIRFTGRSDTSGSRDTFIALNSDSGSNYSANYMYQEGASVSAGLYSNQTNLLINDSLPGTNFNSNLFGFTEVYIPNYLESQNKQINAVYTNANYASAVTGRYTIHAHQYRSTTAISTIALTGQNNFVAGSTFYLYGVKNS
jgi:hypothetical protein